MLSMFVGLVVWTGFLSFVALRRRDRSGGMDRAARRLEHAAVWIYVSLAAASVHVMTDRSDWYMPEYEHVAESIVIITLYLTLLLVLPVSTAVVLNSMALSGERA